MPLSDRPSLLSRLRARLPRSVLRRGPRGGLFARRGGGRGATRRDGGRRLTPGAALGFLALAIGKAREDELTERASALAFITIVSLIPLLAVFSHFGAGQIVNLLNSVLPYSEDAIFTAVDGFLKKAEGIGLFGFCVFLATSLAAFTTIEQTVNRIWNVAARRSFRSRLLSFTLVIFWGPLLIAASYSLIFYLRDREPFFVLRWEAPLRLFPSLVTLVGLTMLYWLVPYTAVRFRSAVAGGAVATLLLEALRSGFGYYVEVARGISVIYGGFGLALFFMISIQLTWWIVLLGSEVAYALQHYRLLTAPRLPVTPFDGSWIGLAALAVIADGFRHGEPITGHERLAERLQMPSVGLRSSLQPLLEAGVLRETGGDDEGYLLAADPYELRVDTVFDLYEQRHRAMLEPLPRSIAATLDELRTVLAASRSQRTGGLTLADVVRESRLPALDPPRPVPRIAG